jgi:NHS family xanthosine MFS transporter
MGWMAMQGADADALLALYTLSVAFYMPTLALSYSVAYSSLELAEQDPIKAYPPIRVWGTVGFICAMLVCDFAGWQQSAGHFLLSA